ncbi:MAG: hypothetical protein MMC33_002889 [Icmadophila ericetorum]|nr:hypothetical protein [Icmadophila ericetorum]
MSAAQAPPRNHKERRAAGKQINNASEIPLARPNRDQPKAKTLYEIAAERQTSLQGGTPFNPVDGKVPSGPMKTVQINTDGTISDVLPEGPSQAEDEPIGELGQALFHALTMTMLHFTLDVLVHHQYRETISWDMIAQRTAINFPLLLTIIYVLHPRVSSLWVQILYLGMSVASGCYLIYSTNELAYFAVMKRAPPLGTLWIWSVVEMRLPFALASVAVATGYFWIGGYSIF